MSPADTVSTGEQVLQYIEDQVTAEGLFLKSRHIAEELDISAKQVGAVMNSVEDRSSDLRVEKWGGNSDGTTWHIERLDQE